MDLFDHARQEHEHAAEDPGEQDQPRALQAAGDDAGGAEDARTDRYADAEQQGGRSAEDSFELHGG